jgi:glycosyltransferase involved in cell wall biosynthesis
LGAASHATQVFSCPDAFISGNNKDMYNNKKVIVIMPAFNAAATLQKTYDEVMAQQIVDLVIVVDDASHDETVSIAGTLPHTVVHVHAENRGYGANQKTCYRLALENGGDIIIMVHPDYQYTPRLIPAMASMIGNNLYSCVLGSRILGGYAIKGGMPVWKYAANRFLTLTENLLTGAKLSEYHTGYRAFSRQLLERIDFSKNSDDFVFDNQMLIQILWHGYMIAEVSCPTSYAPDASSINFRRSVIYGFGCLATALRFRLARMGIMDYPLFARKIKKPNVRKHMDSDGLKDLDN